MLFFEYEKESPREHHLEDSNHQNRTKIALDYEEILDEILLFVL